MPNPDHMSRIDSALGSAEPEGSLVALIRDLEKEGLDPSEIYALFEEQLLRHRDTNEAFYDDLADMMDRIADWCSPEQRLFDGEFQSGKGRP
jgi:hypothetical protein